MNSTMKSVLCAMLLTLSLGLSTCFVGCDGATLKVYQENSITQIARGNTLDITYEAKGLKEGDKVELKVEGDATIEQTENGGKLTANTDAEVGSEIKVWAEAGSKKSKALKITVIDLAPTAVSLNLVSDKIKVGGGRVSFNVGLTPTYATIRNYQVSVTKINNATPTDENKNWASIVDDEFVLGADAPVGTVFELTASIVGHTNITNTATITVVETTPVDQIVANDITINTVSDSNKTADITGYYQRKKADTTADMFTYSSSDENIAKVNASGAIEAKGHGEATITVSAPGSTATTTFKVFVIAPPTSIELEGVSSLITQKSTFSYGKADNLSLNLKGINANYTCSNAYTFDFAMLDDNGNTISSVESSDIATVDNNNVITFKQTGKVQITIKSNSTLNNVKTTEAQKTIVVNVNDGVNISTVEQFKNYAYHSTKTVANIVGNVSLTESENFGVGADGTYLTLEFSGNRTINGNGYVISTQNLPLSTTGSGGADFLRFIPTNAETPFSVKIYDLSIIGCGGVTGKYSGNISADNGKDVVATNGDYINTYRRGLRIQGASYDEVSNKTTKGYVKDMEVSNVSVSGFDVAIRIDHAVDGHMSDISVSNCYSNGMEFSQNTLTLNNITLGQVGAFGIEMTPDDMKDKKTTNPQGTAGANYNETASLTLTGYITSTNYNNGASTDYMAGLSSQLTMTIPSLINAINTAMINQATKNLDDTTSVGGKSPKTIAQEKLENILSACLEKEITTSEGTAEKAMNFYLLIFVNKAGGMVYDAGNTENRFAIYTSNESRNMISVTEILTACAQDPNYDGYKQYQYIQMDLTTGDVMGNIGQVILVNQAYDRNYTPSTNA